MPYFLYLSLIALGQTYALGQSPSPTINWTEFASPLSTEVREKETQNCYDLNKDNKTDLCFIYDSSQFLLEKRKDHNFDGEFDWFETYGTADQPAYFRKVIIDSNSYETTREEHYKTQPYLVTSLYVNNVLIKTTRALVVDQIENSETCKVSPHDKFVNALNAVITKAAVDKTGFFQTPYGLRIHKSCLDKRGGHKAANEFSQSLSQGLQCLKKLNTPKSSEHLAQMKELFQAKPKPQVICNEMNYNWNETNAHATVSAKQKGHPMVSMNPNTCKDRPSGDYKATFFHELFHNLGYRHGLDPEYAYTCSDCCFSNEKNKNAACDLCKENHKSISEPAYLKKLLAYDEYSIRVDVFEQIESAVTANPKNKDLINLKMQYLSTPFQAALGSAYLKHYEKLGIPISSEHKQHIEYYQNLEYNKPLLPAANAVAQAQILISRGELTKAGNVLSQIRIPDKIKSKEHGELYGYSKSEVLKAEYNSWVRIFLKSMETQETVVSDIAMEQMARLRSLGYGS